MAMFRTPPMEAGRLRKRLAIQSASESQNAHGDTVFSWSTDDTVWGQIVPLSEKEVFAAKQVDVNATHRVIIRAYSGLTASMRILYGTRVFNIVGVKDIEEKGTKMHVLVKEDQGEAST